ncbi:uncharacterized protein METZ01_LOCUS140280 [marine metagenome]|uniref:Uncharacterized protein n=1 Tax=marine metagenome TaxID=408172 RepID=A0A381ZDU3_9ZZZZ
MQTEIGISIISPVQSFYLWKIFSEFNNF